MSDVRAVLDWLDRRITDERVRAINSETMHSALMAQAKESALREVEEMLKTVKQ
jgi:hypothetical protein